MRLLSRHELGLAKLASKDSARGNLQALHVRSEVVEVTNGHYLARIWEHVTPGQDDFPVPPEGSLVDILKQPEAGFLLDADTALAAGKALPKNPTCPVLGFAASGINGNGRPKVATTDLGSWNMREALNVEGRFPNTDRIWPKGKKFTEVILSAQYLKDLAAVVLSMDIGRTPGIRIRIFRGDGPVELAAGNCERHFGAALMPMRDSGIKLPGDPEPEAKPEPEAATAAA